MGLIIIRKPSVRLTNDNTHMLIVLYAIKSIYLVIFIFRKAVLLLLLATGPTAIT